MFESHSLRGGLFGTFAFLLFLLYSAAYPMIQIPREELKQFEIEVHRTGGSCHLLFLVRSLLFNCSGIREAGTPDAQRFDCVDVVPLPKDGLVEIDLIAVS